MPTETCCPVLKRTYGSTRVSAHNYSTALSSATFGGTIVGMLVFGYLSDKIGTSISAAITSLSFILTLSRTQVRNG